MILTLSLFVLNTEMGYAKIPSVIKNDGTKICVSMANYRIDICDMDSDCAIDNRCKDIVEGKAPKKRKSLGFYISGKIIEVKKYSVILSLDDNLPSIYVPKRFISEIDQKVGARIWREVSEKEIIQISKVKGGGGSR